MRPETHRRSRPGLGTLVEIAVAADAGEAAACQIEAGFAQIAALESRLSRHRPDSELNLVCREAHRRPQTVSTPLREVLAQALELQRLSDGIFDVAVADRRRPGGDRAARFRLDAAGRVDFDAPLRLDLGGIAKGYVVDAAVAALQAAGAERGCVNAGGDLRVFGDWTEPFALRFADGLRCVARLGDGAVASSRPGARPLATAACDDAPHRDGRSGAALSHDDTVVVSAPTALLADALTKVALVCASTMDRLGAHYGAEWRRYPFDPRAMADAAPVRHAA